MSYRGTEVVFHQIGLLFTAGPEYCANCDSVLREYHLAARLYEEQHNSTMLKDPGVLLFFFTVSAADSPELFQSLGISYAPQLFVIGPKTESDPKQPLSDFMIDLNNENDLVKAISEKSGLKVVATSSAMMLCLVNDD